VGQAAYSPAGQQAKKAYAQRYEKVLMRWGSGLF
jgi:hypothetical protein